MIEFYARSAYLHDYLFMITYYLAKGSKAIKIKIVCVGKLKEDFYVKAQAEYAKMLGRFCALSVEELPDEPLSNVKGENAERAVREAEGERILKKCEGFVVACDVRGKQMPSEAFAQKLGDLMTGGVSTVSFVVAARSGFQGRCSNGPTCGFPYRK